MFAEPLKGLTIEELLNLEIITADNKISEIRSNGDAIFVIPTEGDEKLLSAFTDSNILGMFKSVQEAAAKAMI